ncbi:hypothetical protein BJY04DRAFT_222551 [Aspergillus karnatakaensis]|uniref:uncharacterized protein n=1 Tax=Aspergillus karnatakaensis TaxID=1810916 RepID=UPI003CCD6314
MLASALFTTAILALAPVVHGHAVVAEPLPRKTGPAHEAACGAAVVDVLENVAFRHRRPNRKRHGEGRRRLQLQRVSVPRVQFEDNTDNVLEVSVGEVLYFHVDLIAGHHPGYAIVSIVDTATNSIIGDPLRPWDDWPNHLSGPPRDDIDYNVTIPDSLGTQCSSAGSCVIQWYWYASGNEQTYECCNDFYVVG